MKAISNNTAPAHCTQPPIPGGARASFPSAADEPRRTYRADYRPPEYSVDHIDLCFELAVPVTRVTATLSITRADRRAGPLVFNGERLRLLSLRLDGAVLPADSYAADERSLTIFHAPASCEIEFVTELQPVDNAGLEGLNHVAGTFFTHCEPEGFRRITYFPDRPDVMARYRCTLIADPVLCPTLLSNGYLRESAALPDGRRYARWEDPYPKSTYVFAIAAGSFETVKDHFITRSGRRVEIAIHAAAEELRYCAYGLGVLKQAMAWDERAYGREYDLDVFNVVVMRSYPGGAMECKGLNLYASEFFVGSVETSTDEELMRVAAIIGHEYFHNWTGNRVGCRDWFELSLKEGFTVYRQQQFTASLFGADAARIDDVKRLRELQYPEDQGGMAHAVRPASYLAISNFYTRTIYDKGAEIIRMMNLIVGDCAFYAASHAFFSRFDGTAATIDSLLDTVETVSGVDLAQFRHWYAAVGGLNLHVAGSYDSAARRYTLRVEQQPVRSQEIATPLHVPLRLGLLGPEGQALSLQLSHEQGGSVERLIELRCATEVLTFEDVPCAPIPSVLRGYSAPAQISLDLDDAALALLATHDSDGFNRWEMAQELATRVLLRLADGADADSSNTAAWTRVAARTLTTTGDHSIAARVIELPSVHQLGLRRAPVDVESLHAARLRLIHESTAHLRDLLQRTYELTTFAARGDAAAGTRRLRNRCLAYLLAEPHADDLERCRIQLRTADRMEDASAALKLLIDRGGVDREQALHRFYEQWQGVASVIDRWFAVQAGSDATDCAARVERLLTHHSYCLDNATRLKAIFDTFTLNAHAFHDRSGLGHDLVMRTILSLRDSNPRLAARFLKQFDGWHRYGVTRRTSLRQALQRVLETPDIAQELYEIASQSLRFGERNLEESATPAVPDPTSRRDRR
jgi:aminopeptidase N